MLYQQQLSYEARSCSSQVATPALSPTTVPVPTPADLVSPVELLSGDF